MRISTSLIVDTLESRRLFSVLTSGLTLRSLISSPTEVDTHTIALKAGQTLLVSLGETSAQAFDPTVQLRAPSGKVLRTDTKEIGSFYRINATETGTYKLRISDDGSNDTGNYALTVFASGSAFSFDEEGGKGESGRRFTGSVSPGDLDVWTLDATAGQFLAASLVENSANSPIAPGMTVFDPNGNVVSDANNEVGQTASFVHDITLTGKYVFIVYDRGSDDSGKYGLGFARLPGPQYTGDPDTATPLVNHVSRAGDVPGGDLDIFPVYVEEGSALKVSVTRATGSLDPLLILFNPDGSIIQQTDGTSSATLNVPVNISGTHWVLVRDRESDDGGKYNIKVDLTIDNKTPAIKNGILTIDGTSDADDIGLTETTHNSLPAIRVRINGKNRFYFRNEVSRIEILAGAGGDNVVANTSVNTYIFGDTGNDTLTGGSGDDTLTSGAGKNLMFGGAGDDRMNGSGGKDEMHGDEGGDRLYGNAGNDILDGGGNVDRLFGGDGDDVLIGGSGNDKLMGEAGNDNLAGGKGSDLLDGGAGTDRHGDKDSADSLVSIEA